MTLFRRTWNMVKASRRREANQGSKRKQVKTKINKRRRTNAKPIKAPTALIEHIPFQRNAWYKATQPEFDATLPYVARPEAKGMLR